VRSAQAYFLALLQWCDFLLGCAAILGYDGARTFLSAAMSARRNALGQSVAVRTVESCSERECLRSVVGL